ncbi:hypothetical protein L4C34_03520 [Vibrio profundum]|uniref:hypothetical protein n=1 Tax=Vibrio profundum TaxID=2910247 RepID=UPI003D110C80
MLKYLQQPSTYKGLALVGGILAASSGHTDLFTVDVSQQGVEYGGAVGGVIVSLVALWEALPDAWKPKKNDH